MTLDLMLPGEDGISLIRSLRTDPATSDLPIVVVSAMAEAGRARINGGFGVVDWLTKPFDREQLTTSVRRAMHAFAGSRARILHVEDDPDVRRVVAALAADLADFEYAGTVAEARARLGLALYELVILDISLPDGSGWELLGFIERLDRPPPVMVFSGTALAVEQARQVASALVKASTSHDDLVKTIRALLRSVSGLNR
jgi:CheY-like chemotaxis protein